MAQIVTGTTDIVGIVVNALRNLIAAIRNRLNVDSAIRAQDILEMMYVYNVWIQHSHLVTDYYWMAYGNTSPYGTTAVTAQTAGVNGVGYSDQSQEQAGYDINRIAVINFIRQINAIISHNHYINDGSY